MIKYFILRAKKKKKKYPTIIILNSIKAFWSYFTEVISFILNLKHRRYVKHTHATGS